MANYKVLNKRKEIIALNPLSERDTEILAIYISQGYKIFPKESKKNNSNNKRLKEQDIISWFKSNNNTKGLKEYKAKREEKIVDKNGKERKGGFLIAQKWFKDNYPDAYNELKATKGN